MGCDPDKVCGYSTIKRVRIKDRYLGFLHMFFILGIVGYIVGYEIFYKMGYLEVEVPIGAIETSLRSPLIFNVSQLPYCEGYQLDPGEDLLMDVQKCMVLDYNEVRYPSESDSSLFLTTRVSATSETKSKSSQECLFVANPSYDDCLVQWEADRVNAGSRFVAQIEDFTVRIRHSWQADKFFTESGSDPKFSGSSKGMQGVFSSKSGAEMKLQAGNEDIFSVAELLSAAGLSKDFLDSESDSSPGESARNAGILLDKATYTYSLSRVPGREYKILENLESEDGRSRKTFNRHGIKIVVLQTGTIGRFSIQTLFIKLVTALGLLSVATVVVELLMIRVMPRRKLYKQAKVEETEDFSDLMARREKGTNNVEPVLARGRAPFSPTLGNHNLRHNHLPPLNYASKLNGSPEKKFTKRDRDIGMSLVGHHPPGCLE